MRKEVKYTVRYVDSHFRERFHLYDDYDAALDRLYSINKYIYKELNKVVYTYECSTVVDIYEKNLRRIKRKGNRNGY